MRAVSGSARSWRRSPAFAPTPRCWPSRSPATRATTNGPPSRTGTYRSRLGDEIDNVAIFEPAELLEPAAEPIGATDADLLAVAELFGLTFI